jgi:hypothetical protein
VADSRRVASIVTRVVAACAAALFIPLLAPLVMGRVLTLDDLAFFHVPVRLLYARALAAGDAFVWTSALGSGFYLHGEGQVGMLHPLHLLLYRALPFVAAFNLEIIWSYAFALPGMFLMLRRMRLSPAASWMGAMAFTFSGFNLMRLLHINTIAVAMHLPWLVLATDYIVAPSRPRERAAGTVAFALAVGSMFLLGYPQFLFISGAGVIAYAVWRAASLGSWIGCAWLTAAFLCGAGIGAVQWLPMLDVLSHSERGESSVGFATTYSLHPMNLLQLVTPYVFRRRAYMLPDELSIHEQVAYTGSFCTLALCWILARWRHLEHRKLAAWAVSIAIAATILALGRFGGLYYVLAALPVSGWFRGPSRFMLLTHFALAMVAAIAFDDLVALMRERRPLAARAIAALAIPAAIGAAFAVGAFALTGRGGVRGAESIALMTGTALLMLLSASGHQRALILLPIVFAADLGLWGYRYSWSEPPASIEEIARRAEVPPGSPGELVYNSRMSNLPILAGYRVANPYVAMLPRLALDREDSDVQRVAGIDWRHTRDGWERVADTMPRVRLLSTEKVSRDPARDLATIEVGGVALVEQPLALDSGPPGDAHIVVDRPGRIVVETRTEGRRILATTERYHQGWTATAGGRPIPTVRVYGDFLACIVEAGPSTVSLTFEPRDLRIGGWITFASCFAIVGIYAYGRYSRQ